MRIGVVLPNLAGAGAQRVLLELAGGLVARGVDVDVVVLTSTGALADDVPTARLIALGGRRVARSVLALARYLRAERPDVLITALNHVNVAAIVAGRLTRPRTPVVVTHHNHLSTAAQHKTTRRDRVMPTVLRFAYPLAARVVAVSEGVADDLARTIGLRRERIDVAYNPVDFVRVAQAGAEVAEHPWLNDRVAPVVVAVGRLTEQKDFESLIRAVAASADWRLLILGEGERRDALERLADELGVAARVRLIGYVENPMPFVRAADVFVLSSRWEGLPTVLIEALAFDTPIVATDCTAGPREILEDGRWGRLVPVGEPAALTAAIGEALQDPRHDRPASRARFDIARVTQSYLDLLP